MPERPAMATGAAHRTACVQEQPFFVSPPPPARGSQQGCVKDKGLHNFFSNTLFSHDHDFVLFEGPHDPPYSLYLGPYSIVSTVQGPLEKQYPLDISNLAGRLFQCLLPSSQDLIQLPEHCFVDGLFGRGYGLGRHRPRKLPATQVQKTADWFNI